MTNRAREGTVFGTREHERETHVYHAHMPRTRATHDHTLTTHIPGKYLNVQHTCTYTHKHFHRHTQANLVTHVRTNASSHTYTRTHAHTYVYMGYAVIPS